MIETGNGTGKGVGVGNIAYNENRESFDVYRKCLLLLLFLPCFVILYSVSPLS